MLKSKNHFIPGSFAYYQAETGWTSESYLGFQETVHAIIAHRSANPRFGLATDPAVVSQQLENYHVARLKAMKGGEAYLIEGSPDVDPSFSWQPLRRNLEGAAHAVKKVSAGIGLLKDFLGPSLKAVPHELAEKRAATCVTCPQNQPETISSALGEGLKLLLEAREGMKLSTTHDASLHECFACQCNLRLKPHVELEYILSRTTPEQMAKLDARCWILRKDAFATV